MKWSKRVIASLLPPVCALLLPLRLAWVQALFVEPPLSSTGTLAFNTLFGPVVLIAGVTWLEALLLRHQARVHLLIIALFSSLLMLGLLLALTSGSLTSPSLAFANLALITVPALWGITLGLIGVQTGLNK